MAERFVIYQDDNWWVGAVEYTTGHWPCKKVRHAPITHAESVEAVFAWLLVLYPDEVIAYDPTLTQRYRNQL